MRCTGHCCQRFSIHLDTLTDPEKDVRDGDMIRGMIVLQEPIDEHQWACGCKHFDGKDCTVYESRPEMCRLYPYGRECRWKGCTLGE